jgi:predicted RNA-binding Zn-ribbon protein involved in translation (DUF1610 family)
MTTKECLLDDIQCGDVIISSCCSASEHKWFPLMCSDCAEFTDFLCANCGEVAYPLDS